jgi:hypothetical protein
LAVTYFTRSGDTDMAIPARAKTTESDNVRPPDSVDFSAAQSAVERLTREYPAIALSNLKAMRGKYKYLKGENPEEELQELRTFAHNFAGQGASFNFPLVSKIADSLRAYLRSRGIFSALKRDIVEAHFEALHEVLDNVLSSDGGDAGRAVLARLENTVASQES